MIVVRSTLPNWDPRRIVEPEVRVPIEEIADWRQCTTQNCEGFVKTIYRRLRNYPAGSHPQNRADAKDVKHEQKNYSNQPRFPILLWIRINPFLCVGVVFEFLLGSCDAKTLLRFGKDYNMKSRRQFSQSGSSRKARSLIDAVHLKKA